MEDLNIENEVTQKQGLGGTTTIDRKRSRSFLNDSDNNEKEMEGSNNEMDISVDDDDNNDVTATANSNNNNNNNNINNTYMEEQEPPSHRQRILDGQSIKGMKLEAIFHPKFENENLNNQQIRKSMIEKVSNGDGMLEVSLKHSGSLILWSGGRRFYSKNATDNVHTCVGEVLLRQHFARAWMNANCDHRDDGGGSSICHTEEIAQETKFLECSNYVESNRLTLSFEVVTSVLGHHGDLPTKDFLILIAVADRKQSNGTTASTFLSTNQVMEFAQRFRLPHNDVWIFQSLESAKKLFHLYDNSRENGLADSVIQTLSQACDGGHIKSLYPHGIFQGQILEGIVIRFVRIDKHDDVSKHTNMTIEQLCEQSDSILKEVLPNLELDSLHTLIKSNDSDFSGPAQLLKINLREIFEANNGDAVAFANVLDSIVKEASHDNESYTSRTVSKLGKKEIDIPSIAERLLLEKNTTDLETYQICTLIQMLEKLKLSVTYHVILEQNAPLYEAKTNQNDTATRYLCIIHILHDACHQKYHVATRTSGGMSLFRGFSIELLTSDEGTLVNETKSLDLNFKPEKLPLQCQQSNITDDKKLMLKMKFLPYMVRTFICRNGLGILSKKGAVGFKQYAFDTLRKWEMSKSAIDTWFGFLSAWGNYCESPSQKTSDGNTLPKLNESNYLHHYYHFEEMYNKGFFKAKSGQATSFYGLVVVVGTDKKRMTELSLKLSSALGCSKTVSAINDFSEANMAASMQSEGGGVICAASITEGVKRLNMLGKRYKENIFIVMIGCTKEEIETEFVNKGNPNTKELKKVVGMTNGWKKAKVALNVQIPNSCFEKNNFESNDSWVKIVEQLDIASKSSKPDNRPGMLVYFPNIPGCGKSSLCSTLTRETLNIKTDRKFIVREGDKTSGKFWSSALQDKLKQPSSIFVADKNVPPPSWKLMDSFCSKSNGIAVSVLPDSAAFEDTRINVVLKGGGEADIVSEQRFPFSLPYLAVCIARVLSRAPNTHNGKLDSATASACMIVVKFYCLYRKLSVSSFFRRISNFGRGTNHLIRVPFFKTEFLPEMPSDLQEVLEEAVSIQTSIELKQGKNENDIAIIENKLRDIIRKHRDFIFALQIAQEESTTSFEKQLSDAISSLGDTFQEREVIRSSTADDFNSIHIVSLDFNRDDVNSILSAESENNSEINDYLSERNFSQLKKTESKDENKKNDRFINKTHCTFAHAQRMRQDQMRKEYGHLIGISCEVKVNAILFSNDVAALDITIPKSLSHDSSIIIPPTTNMFAHITIWCKKGVKAFNSNQLPKLVVERSAKRMELQRPYYLKGTFSFWYD